MKVKYLKLMHNANIGDVLEVTDFEANILIKAGVVESVEGQLQVQTAQPEVKTIVYTPIDTHGLLLNLNGTPVVNDFGDLVAESNKPETEAKPKPQRKPRSKKTDE